MTYSLILDCLVRRRMSENVWKIESEKLQIFLVSVKYKSSQNICESIAILSTTNNLTRFIVKMSRIKKDFARWKLKSRSYLFVIPHNARKAYISEKLMWARLMLSSSFIVIITIFWWSSSASLQREQWKAQESTTKPTSWCFVSFPDFTTFETSFPHPHVKHKHAILCHRKIYTVSHNMKFNDKTPFMAE